MLQAREQTSYFDLIKKYTTRPEFITHWIEGIREVEGIPSPRSYLGYIPGTPGKLSDVNEIHGYFRKLAQASPRVHVEEIGVSEEGRPILLAVIADESTLQSIEEYMAITEKLSDPRKLSDKEAEALIQQGKPIYWLLGGLHSPETGSPEMLMELAYYLATGSSPEIEEIRKNVIVLITPVQEVDGRARYVDIVRYHEKYPDKPIPPLVYWGHYVVHDNNRDAIGLSLRITQSLLKAFHTWHPLVMHDLHESVPFLYIMGGTGPFNAWIDPSVIDEWRTMAWNEVKALTAEGVPGVWTHGFWDGWAPNYMFYIAMGRNSVGRFYETFGNSLPDTFDRTVLWQSSRTWFRPNPPYRRVKWSLRNNVNLMESGVLEALLYTARHGHDMLRTFYLRTKRTLKKPYLEGPSAWVLPSTEPKKLLQARLVRLLLDQGIEIHVLKKDYTVKIENKKTEKQKQLSKKKAPKKPIRIPKGSYIIRMDQPSARLADMLLDTQYYNPKDPRPYDDTGWTLGEHFHVKTIRVTDTGILDVPMVRTTDPYVNVGGFTGKGPYWIITQDASPELYGFLFKVENVDIQVLTLPFKVKKRTFPAGSFVIKVSPEAENDVKDLARSFHLQVFRTTKAPEHTVEWKKPRIAIIHSWINTQDEGWYRLLFDTLGIPFDYIQLKDIRDTADLKSRWDILILAPGIGTPQHLVNGLPASEPIPWKKTDLTPNLGRIDSTDDIRPGMGFEGVLHLRDFIEKGGTLICIGSSVRFPVELGLVTYVQVEEPRKLKAQGTLVKAETVEPESPLQFGYEKAFTVYYPGDIILKVGLPLGRFERYLRAQMRHRPSGRGRPDEPDTIVGRKMEPPVKPPERKPWEEGFIVPDPFFQVFVRHLIPPVEKRPRIVLRYAKKEKELFVSGLLENGRELAGTPALVDIKRGAGHVLLYGFNPVWRHHSWGQVGLFLNGIVYHNRLAMGWPPATQKTQQKTVQAQTN